MSTIDTAFETRITNLQPHGNGWSWTREHDEPQFNEDGEYTGDKTISVACRTNQNGEGLWIEEYGQFKQILGTCQYRLSQTRSSARRQINNGGAR